MKSIFVVLSLLAIASGDVSHLGGISNQYLPPGRPQQPSGGYIPPFQPQRPGRDYLPPLQSSVFPSGPQAPVFSPSVPVQRPSLPAFQPGPSYNPPSAPVFSPNVPINNYLPPLQTQIQHSPSSFPAPAPTSIGTSITATSASGCCGSLGEGIYSEPAPAHSFGPSGYNYRRPSGGFSF